MEFTFREGSKIREQEKILLSILLNILNFPNDYILFLFEKIIFRKN